ncbi:hypothetical protein R5R35_014539 [Gryllus longicercus]|uniref:Uncharacterized protein n=1 Tax=Gryllus longicercus TaxID=2509291 RepID=A0AAN9VTG9_9ORTH
MSDHDDNDSNSDESSMINDGTNTEHVANPLVKDFISYSDSVDERMLGMVNRQKESSEIRFNSWERRGDFHELSSDSEEELSPNEDVLMNGRRGPAKAQELVKKFNTIEFLRDKENFKQSQDNETPKLSFSAPKAQQEDEESEQKNNEEEFFGCKRLRKKQRNMWKGKESTSDDSDGPLSDEESDREIDELVELLSSTSLIKIYDENLALPKEEDEILKTFLQPKEKENPPEGSNKIQRKKAVESLIDIFEYVPESETEDTSNERSVDDELDWKAAELCSTLDGYDINNQSSFHDWMLDKMLSKSLNTTSEPELTVCSKCFSIHNGTRECF